MSKEEIYDSEISPLMTQIIAISKRANIPCHASFALDGDLACTTHVDPGKKAISQDDVESYDDWRRKYSRLADRAVGVPDMKITTRNAAGEVTGVEVIHVR